jgi:hypothetical protein
MNGAILVWFPQLKIKELVVHAGHSQLLVPSNLTGIFLEKVKIPLLLNNN